MKWLLVCVTLHGCGLEPESQKSIAEFDERGACESARGVAERHSNGMHYYVCANRFGIGGYSFYEQVSHAGDNPERHQSGASAPEGSMGKIIMEMIQGEIINALKAIDAKTDSNDERSK